MPILHIETEVVREAVVALTAVSEEADQQARQINGRSQAMLVAWQGGSQQEFATELDQHLYQLRRLAQQGHELASRLRREVEQWEIVDQIR